jgi:hypothetical protein
LQTIGVPVLERRARNLPGNVAALLSKAVASVSGAIDTFNFQHFPRINLLRSICISTDLPKIIFGMAVAFVTDERERHRT